MCGLVPLRVLKSKITSVRGIERGIFEGFEPKTMTGSRAYSLLLIIAF